MWYSLNDLLSKNAIFNVVMSMRGPGKTYSFKKWMIRDFLKTGKQGMYIRRYSTELSTISTFFDDIKKNNEFPDVSFEVKGGKKGGKFLINKQVAGYFFALASQASLKSSSWPEVNKICYDEAILEPGNLHYLPNEPFHLFNLIETVNRLRASESLHDLVRVILFGNTVSIVNPYFEYLKVTPSSERFTIPKEYNKDLVIEIFKDEQFNVAKKITRHGAFMAKTSYGNYAIDGEFYADNTSFIEPLPKEAICTYEIFYRQKSVYFWYLPKKGLIYASYQHKGTNLIKMCLSSEDHTDNFFLIKSAQLMPQCKTLISAFQNGCLRFESQSVKQSTIDILQVLGVRKK